jgi:hypothetical protein
MASLYGAVTVANLEAFSGNDYSAIDAALTDGVIESMGISPAEVLCKGWTGTAPSSTSENEVKYGIMAVADWKIMQWIKSNGVNPNTPELREEMLSQIDLESYWGLQKQTNTQIRTVWIGDRSG